MNGNLSTVDRTKFIVTFDSKGGTIVNSQEVYQYEKITKPDDPTKAGYTFDGWYYDIDNNDIYDSDERWSFFGYSVTENIALEAKWMTNEYTITFETNGANETLLPIVKHHNEILELPEVTKTDYIFNGWFVNDKKIEGNTIVVTSNMVLKARWGKKITISFNSNGGTPVDDIEAITGSNIVSLPTPTLDDALFKGWYYNGSLVELPYYLDELSDDIMLTAQWRYLSEEFSYELVDNEAIITNYNGTYSNVTIPNTIDGYSVTSIDSEVFMNNTNITSVEIENGVTSLGDNLFNGCSNLKSLSIPYSVITYGTTLLSGCNSLEELTIPSTINVSLKDMYGISKSSDLPKSLYTIKLSENSNSFPDTFFLGNSNKYKLYLPSSLKYIPSNFMTDKPFIENIVIPEGVTSIGGGAFSGCSSLTSIVIPEGVTSIGYNTFYECSSLTSIVIPESVTSIDSGTFYGCSSLTSIVIPESVRSIDYMAFSGCSSLTSIVIPESVTSIDSGTFYGCSSLTSIVIPEGVTSIGSGTFSGCSSLTSIVIPEGVTTIGGSAFSGCSSLTSIVIPESVTTIGGFAFSECSSLTSIVIPEGVVSIGDNAFSGCGSLSSIVIPETVTSIGEYAFSYCGNLTIYCELTSEPTTGWDSSWNYYSTPVYWYSETQPSTTGNYWHYVDGVPTIW